MAKSLQKELLLNIHTINDQVRVKVIFSVQAARSDIVVVVEF